MNQKFGGENFFVDSSAKTIHMGCNKHLLRLPEARQDGAIRSLVGGCGSDRGGSTGVMVESSTGAQERNKNERERDREKEREKERESVCERERGRWPRSQKSQRCQEGARTGAHTICV